MKVADREEMFRRFAADCPEPKTELHYESDFQLLVAVMLSAQATDVSVNRVTPELFLNGPDPTSMSALGVERIRDLIKSIGLFNSKAMNISKTSQLLVERHQGQVPQTLEELVALPGVGRKTANVVLNVAFGQPTMAVDTHIFRVGNRTGLATGKTPEAVELKLLKAVPKRYLLYAHHWLILHGRYTCLARQPQCQTCRISDLCRWRHKSKSVPGG